jgi:coenzyme Q-binding protein COQ10
MDMVLDVERYGEFVPYCERVAIREQFDRSGKMVMTAAMTVGVSIFNETFVSRVIADRTNRTIKVTGINGPLKSLVNDWQFNALETAEQADGAEIDFHVSFEFKSRMLALLADSRVESVCRKIMDAFVDRAHELYGQNAPATA